MRKSARNRDASSAPHSHRVSKDLSNRLTHHFATCSTTPRSGQVYVHQLMEMADRVCAHETLYSEAKLALAKQDFRTARELFNMCPPTYKRTKTYVRKCDTFQRLCREGVVRRPEVDELVSSLTVCLHEDDLCGTSLVTYAERLWEHGYTRSMVDGATLWQVDALMLSAQFSKGHEERFLQHVKEVSSWWACVVYDIDASVKKCGGINAVLKLAKNVNPL